MTTGKKFDIAFFPWVEVNETIRIGKYKILPYSEWHKKYCAADAAVSNYLNRIFACYFRTEGKSIVNPALIVKDTDISSFEDDEMSDLITIRNIIAYAAICINDYRKERLSKDNFLDVFHQYGFQSFLKHQEFSRWKKLMKM